MKNSTRCYRRDPLPCPGRARAGPTPRTATVKDPWLVKCETCGKELAPIYDFAEGGEASIWVCWDCEPPRIFCRACCERHPCPEAARPAPAGTDSTTGTGGRDQAASASELSTSLAMPCRSLPSERSGFLPRSNRTRPLQASSSARATNTSRGVPRSREIADTRVTSSASRLNVAFVVFCFGLAMSSLQSVFPQTTRPREPGFLLLSADSPPDLSQEGR